MNKTTVSGFMFSALLVGCLGESSDTATPIERKLIDPRPTEGTSYLEFGLVGGDTPAGFVDFYIGDSVRADIIEHGDFIESDDEMFSMIRVPIGAVNEARRDGLAVLSLCDADSGALVRHQIVSAGFPGPSPGECVATSHVTRYEPGVIRMEVFAGGDGVFGGIVVGLREDGTLTAGAVVHARTPSACPEQMMARSPFDGFFGFWPAAAGELQNIGCALPPDLE